MKQAERGTEDQGRVEGQEQQRMGTGTEQTTCHRRNGPLAAKVSGSCRPSTHRRDYGPFLPCLHSRGKAAEGQFQPHDQLHHLRSRIKRQVKGRKGKRERKKRRYPRLDRVLSLKDERVVNTATEAQLGRAPLKTLKETQHQRRTEN